MAQSQPAVFIGSSTETLDIAEALQVNLVKHAEVTIWSQGVFGPSTYTLDALSEQMRRSDYAILIADADDVTISRGKAADSARDNVLVEYGMAVAYLGRERTFLVHDANRPPKPPTDMLGINALKYGRRSDNNFDAMMAPVATQLRRAMEKTRLIGDVEAESSEFLAKAIRYLADAGAGALTGRAGVDVVYRSGTGRDLWQRDLIEMMAELFGTRASDVSVGVFTEARRTDGSRALRYLAGDNLSDPEKHYPYAWNEGLAGRVWASGVPAAHSAERPHQWWVIRTECLNATYLCAPLAAGETSYGIVSVGSDEGFRIFDSDLQILEMFAQALTPTLVREDRRSTRSIA